ncbi:ABC transporter permease [Nocardioides sp. GXZ039]|uniref:ABC transporter permease n=1 Tax=Nocardioides sp. GXZ039 TaxID=3136018 RepID=UPI0030F383D0
MRTVLLSSLRLHTRRYVSAILAVVISVAFVVTIAALSAAARDGLTRGVSAPFENADVVATAISGRDAADLMAAAPKAGADASVVGWAELRVARDATTVDGVDQVASIATAPDLRWPTLVDGTFPTGPGEAAVDDRVAEDSGIAVGDTLEVGRGGQTSEVRVTAVVDSPSAFLRSEVYLTWPDLAPFADQMLVDSVAWAGPEAAITKAVPTAKVMASDQYVDDLTKQLNHGVDVTAIMLLLFGAIALFVSVLVIANTFSILLAQRQRDLALLRCVGATRRQVRRSVRLEALAIGVLAAAIGLIAGTALGHGLVAALNSWFPNAGLGHASVSPTWYVAAGLTGVLVTLVASWLPTRRVTTVSPLAALRPGEDVEVRSAAGRLRLAAGFVTVAVGAVLLGVSVATTEPLVMVLGGILAFSGVLMLGPVLMPALIGLTGRLTGRVLGTPGRLAAGNAVRHPRRTAATTASLLIGVTLTTAVLTGMASTRAALSSELDTSYPIDASLTVGPEGAQSLDPDAAKVVGAIDGVEQVVTVPGVRATVGQLGPLEILGRPADDGLLRGDGTELDVADDEIALPVDLGIDEPIPDRVTVQVDGHSVQLRTVVKEGFGNTSALVSSATLARLTSEPHDAALWLRIDDDADSGDLADRLDVAASGLGADLENGFADRAFINLQLDIMTGAVVGLLGMAVVVALIGIANTLGLSVLERTREHALLRALGLTRRQLRTMLGVEAVLLSVVATVLGTAIGATFAWVGVEALIRKAVSDAPLVLPWGQLAIVVLISAAAGLLACVLPARRAARVTPAAGLATD